jgi:GNAT superfamily N-acetyltransferase
MGSVRHLRQAMIEVTGLAVAESARGAHLGRQLLQGAEQRARAVGCRLALVPEGLAVPGSFGAH